MGGRVDLTLTPERVLADYPKTKGRQVLWGGRILESRNLADSTELTILAFPIDNAGIPQTGNDIMIGRFILVQAGYLETIDYAPGREITVYGQVAGSREAVLGETRIQQPVLTALQIHLWRPALAGQLPWWSGIHLGFGISGGF